MYGGEAFSQNVSAAGVTYNCGGESRNPLARRKKVHLFQTLLCLLSFLFYCTDCGSEVVLRPGDIVICRECGYRILYKKRTKQSESILLIHLRVGQGYRGHVNVRISICHANSLYVILLTQLYNLRLGDLGPWSDRGVGELAPVRVF